MKKFLIFVIAALFITAGFTAVLAADNSAASSSDNQTQKSAYSVQGDPVRCPGCDGACRDHLGRTCTVCKGRGLVVPVKPLVLNTKKEGICPGCDGVLRDHLGRTCTVCRGTGIVTADNKAKSIKGMDAKNFSGNSKAPAVSPVTSSSPEFDSLTEAMRFILNAIKTEGITQDNCPKILETVKEIQRLTEVVMLQTKDPVQLGVLNSLVMNTEGLRFQLLAGASNSNNITVAFVLVVQEFKKLKTLRTGN